MKKKLGIIMMATVLATLAAGCGKKSDKTAETTAELTTEYKETEATSEEVTTVEEETTTETTETNVKYALAHSEPGLVYTAKEIYGREYDYIRYSFNGEDLCADDYLIKTKEAYSELSTKYRDLYKADLEALPFTCAYRNDEGNPYALMTQEELEELSKGAASVAEQFALLYWTHDMYGATFGSAYDWPLEDFVYNENVTFNQAQDDIEAILITELKCDSVYLLNKKDGTMIADVYFQGYGVADQKLVTENEASTADVLIRRELYLIYTDNEWKVANTPETNSELKSRTFLTEENGKAWHWAVDKCEVGDFVDIIGDSTNDVKSKER